MNDAFIAVWLGILGVLFGSFVNAFVWRWRQTHDDDGNLKKLSKKRAAELSITKGRSMCPSCKHRLRAYDLIPIGSWLSLRGKCRYCSKPIGWQYPLVELTTGLLFVGSYVWWPHGLSGLGWAQLALWLTIVVGLVALAVYDLRWLLLPFKLIYPLLGLAAMMILLRSIDMSDWSILLESIIATLVLGGLFYSLHMLSGGKWMGGGDVVAAPMLGLLASGLPEVFLLVFIASLLGIVVGLPMIVRAANKKLQIPFGPMLFAAVYIVVLFGDRVTDWYFDSLLL